MTGEGAESRFPFRIGHFFYNFSPSHINGNFGAQGDWESGIGTGFALWPVQNTNACATRYNSWRFRNCCTLSNEIV
jgi:hypothetical protein